MSSVEKLRELLLKPEQVMEDLFHHIASGGSAIDICEDWGVSYPRLMRWVHDDQERTRLINEAFEDRKEYAKEKIILELQRLAHFDPRNLFNADNSVKDPSDWSREIASMVSSFDISVNKDGDETLKVKFWNKEKALELLGKNIQMFIERVDHSGKISLEDLVTISREPNE